MITTRPRCELGRVATDATVCVQGCPSGFIPTVGACIAIDKYTYSDAG